MTSFPIRKGSTIKRVEVPPSEGGGFITISCKDDVSLKQFKNQTLAQMERKITRPNRTGSLNVGVADFGLSIVHPNDPNAEKELVDGVNLRCVMSDAESSHIRFLLKNKAESKNGPGACTIGGIRTCWGKYIVSFEDATNSVQLGSFGHASSYSSNWTIRMEGDEKNGKSVTIQDYRGRYLTANSKGEIYTESRYCPWAIWFIEDLVDKYTYFKNIHGMYLTASDGKIHCDGKGAWGKFEIYRTAVDGYLKFQQKKSRWSKNCYFRLSERTLRCWSEKPSEFNDSTSASPKKRRALFRIHSRNKAPKGEWDTRKFRYIAKEGVKKMAVNFYQGPPLYLEASTQEECNVWYNALMSEKKAAIPQELSQNAKKVEYSRNSILESNSEMSQSRSRSFFYQDNEWEEDGMIDLIEPVNISSMWEYRCERENKERNDAKIKEQAIAQQLKEKVKEHQQQQLQLKEAQKELERLKKQLQLMDNEETTNPKHRLEQEYEALVKENKRRKISLKQPNTDIIKELEDSLKDDEKKRKEMSDFIQVKIPDAYLPSEGKSNAKLLAELEQFKITFGLRNLRQSSCAIHVVKTRQLEMEIEELRSDNENLKNQHGGKAEFEAERKRIELRKLRIDKHAEELNQKIIEYNAGLKRLMQAKERNKRQMAKWKKNMRDCENELQKSQNEFRDETGN